MSIRCEYPEFNEGKGQLISGYSQSYYRTINARKSVFSNLQMAVYIIDYLDLPNIGKIARVCKNFHNTVNAPILWKNLIKRTNSHESKSCLSKPRSINWKEYYELHALAKKWNEDYQKGMEEGPQLVRMEITIYSLAVTTLYACNTTMKSWEHLENFHSTMIFSDFFHAATITYMFYVSVFIEARKPRNFNELITIFESTLKHSGLLFLLEFCDSRRNGRNFFSFDPFYYSRIDPENRYIPMSELLPAFIIGRYLLGAGRKLLEIRSTAVSCAIRTVGCRLYYHLRNSIPFKTTVLSCLAIGIINSKILVQTTSGKIEEQNTLFEPFSLGYNILVPATLLLGKETLKKEKPRQICKVITMISHSLWSAISQCFKRKQI